MQLKKDYLAGVGDSLDLVVVGADNGKGKRTNVYGAFLLACYDAEAEEYQTICKIGTGFSEEMLQSHYEALKPLETAKPRGDIKAGSVKSEVWFEPKIVWEVLAADLSLSPIYTAGQGLVWGVAKIGDIGLMTICRLANAASRCVSQDLSAYEMTKTRTMRLLLNRYGKESGIDCALTETLGGRDVRATGIDTGQQQEEGWRR